MINGMTCGNVTLKCASELSDMIKSSFQTILSQVAEFSPSDSSVRAELEMKEGLYNANIEIHSQELNFKTEKSDGSVVSLLGDIKEELMEQINAWKKMRIVEAN